ncbi:MAG: type IV secretion system protein [Burkholderiaceae bacterium]|nr:type IV secretion system protein [Burkholderiaceae bacterium]
MRHVCALALACTTTLASAQGIPVIDAANLAQTVQQVVHAITQIDNQIRQITQLQSQLDSISGVRNLGRVFDNPLLRNYVPAQAFTVLNAVDTAGYGSLSTTAKALRDAVMVYNCGDLPDGAARNQCQAALAQPYQHKGLLQDAMRTAAGRLAQIDALMAQVDATDDQKAVLEIQARIGAEGALLAHEASQVQLLQAMADSEERIARSRDRERQYQMLRRTGRIADYLP